MATRISESAKKRLVTLYHFLSSYYEPKITSLQLKLFLGFSDSLIRRDISDAGFNKGSSAGYKTSELLFFIKDFLGIKDDLPKKKCCIVGLGHLGTALLDGSYFEKSSFKITAGFDSNVNRTEILRCDFPLYPASKIESVIPPLKIEYAILTVPDKEAALMTERLIKSGISGIVNFTSAVLPAAGVKVENVSPITALINLSAENNICKNIS